MKKSIFTGGLLALCCWIGLPIKAVAMQRPMVHTGPTIPSIVFTNPSNYPAIVGVNNITLGILATGGALSGLTGPYTMQVSFNGMPYVNATPLICGNLFGLPFAYVCSFSFSFTTAMLAHPGTYPTPIQMLVTHSPTGLTFGGTIYTNGL